MDQTEKYNLLALEVLVSKFCYVWSHAGKFSMRPVVVLSNAVLQLVVVVLLYRNEIVTNLLI